MEHEIPPDLALAFDLVQPLPPLWDLVSRVARRASLTAEPDTPGYVGVRPAAHGAIAGYVNKRCVDLQLSPERATSLALQRRWQLRSKNASTGTLRVTADALEDADVMELTVDLFLEALDKSEAGPPFEGGNVAHRVYAAQQPICPVHGTEMLGGHCDRCE